MAIKPAGEATATSLHAPLVTIVILNHNYGAFIRQCIQSVDRQAYPNIQCIILECASSDNSLEVIEQTLGEVRNNFFQLVRRDNRSQMINSLSALADIKGTFVSYLDADDFLFPEFVATHVKAHLNDVDSAAISVTDQIQIDANGEVLAGTCHWHQKWRAFEQDAGWKDLTQARGWVAGAPHQLAKMDVARLYYVPAWWSSWLPDRWIWGATSAMMLRRSVLENLAPPVEQASELRSDTGFDGYFARFAHSVGGTLVIDSAQGAYRRHSRNMWSKNEVLGGQTPNGSHDEAGRFANIQHVASRVLTANHANLMKRLGGQLYYSIAWQLMSNQDFREFADNHPADQIVWEKIIRVASAAGS